MIFAASRPVCLERICEFTNVPICLHYSCDGTECKWEEALFDMVLSLSAYFEPLEHNSCAFSCQRL